MSVPERMAGLLAEVDQDLLPGVLTIGRECEGAQFHSPTPLVIRSVHLIPEGWGADDDETVHLCGTCEANLAILCLLLRLHEGNLEWAVRREFGNIIRAFGMKAWEKYQSALEESA